MTNNILLTIDVEDWFQVENFKKWIPFSTWSSRELRVEKNTHRLLDLFDTYNSTLNQQPGTQNSEYNSHSPICATFFVLGWLAEQLPHVIREIHARGHEVASHGYQHDLCDQISPKNLKKDLIDSKKLIEDLVGERVWGYRAPSFSINDDTLKIIEECGYLYDSSYNSFFFHERYGQVDLSRNRKKGIAFELSKTFFELPISNLQIKRFILPWGGGGYFRLIPYPIFKVGVQKILKKEKAYLIYIHPWEIDPTQPRVNKASTGYKFRHYINLNKTKIKIASLIRNFSHLNFVTCRQYLENKGLL